MKSVVGDGFMAYLAHLRDDGHVQLLREHLFGTAERAASYASAFGEGAMGRFVGTFHDLGKYSPGFQNRILNDGPKVDHSSAGAKEIISKLPLGAFCIAGHHGGLMNKGSKFSLDDGTLYSRIQKKLAGKLDYSVFRKEDS